MKVSWSEKSQTSEAAVYHEIKKFQHDDPYISEHVPELIACWDIPLSTDTIRRELGLSEKSKHPAHCLRMLLFEKLEHLDTLGDPTDVMNAWINCYRCHFGLWLHGIEHSDVSAVNLMVRKGGPKSSKASIGRDKNRTYTGVLSDFDLAFVQNSGKRGVVNTGTVPFMAMILLCPEFWEGKIERLYRHDCEAFVWVLARMILRRGGSATLKVARDWIISDYVQSLKEKNCFISTAAYLLDQATKVNGDLWQVLLHLLLWIHDDFRDHLLVDRADKRRASHESMDVTTEACPHFRKFEEQLSARLALYVSFQALDGSSTQPLPQPSS